MNSQSRFDTIDLSDPLYEPDSLRFLTIKSPALKGRGDITMFVPEGSAEESLPLVLLLHGVYGSHWDWAFNGGAHLTAQAMISAGEIRPMVLAMPSDGLWGDGSGYVAHSGMDYEGWIIEDVLGALVETIPQIDEHSPLFISGLSMGGFGAMRLGAKYPERFAGISGHSSITHFEQMRIFSRQDFSTYRLADPADVSVLDWMVRNRDRLPPLRFDCGREDLLIAHNRSLHQDLEAHRIDHIYEEFNGGHSWAYWSEHLTDTLRFFHGIEP